MTRRRRIGPALWFVAPALGLIGVFFLLPVVASLVLSFTDFDIYAIADARHLRLVGADNYAGLLPSGRRSGTRSTSSSSAVRSRLRSRSAPRSW